MSAVTRILAVTAATALLAAACGDDGGGESLSQEDWIVEADALCADANQEIDDLPQPTSQAEAVDYINSAVEIQQQLVTDLRDLPRPDEGEATVNDMLDSVEQGINELADDPEGALQSGSNEALDNASQLASDYGLQECGT